MFMRKSECEMGSNDIIIVVPNTKKWSLTRKRLTTLELDKTKSILRIHNHMNRLPRRPNINVTRNKETEFTINVP